MWTLYSENIKASWKEDSNTTCMRDPTLLEAPILFTSILQIQLVKLLIALDQDRFLELDHEFMSVLCSLLSFLVACCILLTLYLTNGTICDKYNIIHFVHKHGVDIVIDNAMFTKTSIKKILGICILTLEAFRRIYKNWDKMKNYSKLVRSRIQRNVRSNAVLPLNDVSIE